jgi:hypothetical protein
MNRKDKGAMARQCDGNYKLALFKSWRSLIAGANL